MAAYVMAHVHATNFGPEIIEYLRTENTTADTIMFDGLPAGYLARSVLDHALPAAG